MKAKVIKPFKDKYTKVRYSEGELLTVTQERFEEMNSTALGILVEEVKQEHKPKKQPASKKKKSKSG